MGICDVIKEGFKLFGKVLDFFRERSKLDEVDKEPTEKPLPEKIPASVEMNTSDMLRKLANDIDWLSIQEEDSECEMNICWGLQLQIQRIRNSRDGAEIAEILRNMRKLSFKKTLKRIDSNCPGLPTMISVLCKCSSRVLDPENDIENITPEQVRDISRNAVELCRNMLLPFTKPERRNNLFPDAAGAISNSIEMFAKTLEIYSVEWSEDLHYQLMVLVDSVVSVLRRHDLSDKSIRGSIERFGKQIAPSFATLAKEHPEKWLVALQFLCGTRPSKNSQGPLCRLWKRLVIVSESDGFAFLREFIESTFECVWKQIEFEGALAKKDSKVAEDIVGCIHSLVKQCYNYPKYSFYWHNQVKPVVVSYMLRREGAYAESKDAVHEYLEKIISLIDSLPKRIRKAPHTRSAIKELPPSVSEPDDTLHGLFKSVP